MRFREAFPLILAGKKMRRKAWYESCEKHGIPDNVQELWFWNRGLSMADLEANDWFEVEEKRDQS